MRSPRPRNLLILAGILALEAATLIAVTLWLLFDLVTEQPSSYPMAIALTVLVAITAVWVSAIAVNTVRARHWIRSAAVTWQILQIAIAVGSFQDVYARPDIGWILLAPAIVALILVLSPSVRAATARTEESDTSEGSDTPEDGNR